MIVPSSRLLFWVGVVVVPFSVLAGTVSSAFAPSAALIGALLTLVVLDAALSPSGLRGITVELPELVRMTKDREGTMEIRIRNEPAKAGRIRIGLPFPPEMVSEHEDLVAILPEGSEWSRVFWNCTPVRRGSYIIDKCYIGTASPLGFWSRRTSVPARTEIRVYPNLLPERKNLAAIFLNRSTLGIHAQRQIGKGREFEKLREYIRGDGYDEIHWKATAKRGRPITKVFQIERTQEVYVIIDASRLSARLPGLPAGGSPTGKAADATTILERFITAALMTGLVAERQGDLFGLLTFSDRILNFVRAKGGKAHFGSCREALYTLHPRIVSPDFDELCTFIRLRLRHRALLVFLTSMDDPALAESLLRNLQLIHRQHLIVVNMIAPSGVRPLFSSNDVETKDDIYRELGGHVLWNNLRELERVTHRMGVKFSLLENEKMCSQLVSQYMNIKRRQQI